ncbi:gfo/Idh/MocA family oxidoreductase [Streptomyces sp. Ru73]|uniref:Gfo/Idh/MocA family protein n=1 Tax=Streptomyces sp. Ru73 TaxID=2080748 RepID=UPI000CDDDAB4|nr:Gfo/Idh/MocA family oxidoreductase [Streptomyces sp. Ru73]POX38908.1 gfo/Idh/MocA family oxidoreductase [Streptomyces sp. Ru73]
MTPRRVGVIGLGAISRYYLAAIGRLPGWELAAVCDARQEALAPHRGRVPCHSEHRALLAQPGLDAVVVAVPNHAHAAICGDALAAGLPVCVEKPLALHPAEGRELTALARARATPLFTAFHRRYNDGVRRLRHDLAAARAPVAAVRVRYLERIEEHIAGDTWYLDPRRCGGGCVADNGPNAFDLVRLLLGDVEVGGAEITRDARGTDRQAVIGLRAAGGATATVELDWSYPGETKDIEVRLADGTVHRADMLAGHPGFKASLWHEYAGILDAFAAARPGEAGTDDGLAALDLVAASYRAEQAATAETEQAATERAATTEGGRR